MPKGNTTFKEDSENENAKQRKDCGNAEDLHQREQGGTGLNGRPTGPTTGHQGHSVGG